MKERPRYLFPAEVVDLARERRRRELKEILVDKYTNMEEFKAALKEWSEGEYSNPEDEGKVTKLLARGSAVLAEALQAKYGDSYMKDGAVCIPYREDDGFTTFGFIVVGDDNESYSSCPEN